MSHVYEGLRSLRGAHLINRFETPKPRKSILLVFDACVVSPTKMTSNQSLRVLALTMSAEKSAKVIAVVGCGPGMGKSVAVKFANEGFFASFCASSLLS